MTVGIYTTCFIDKSIEDHLVDATIYAFIEFFALTAQAYLDDIEWTLLDGACTKRSVGLSRHIAYLKGMNDTLGILEVYDAVILRIKQTQLIDQRFETFTLIAVEQGAPGKIVDRRNIVDTPVSNKVS